MLNAWGWRDETGGSVPANVQIAAFYRLIQFREHAYVTAIALQECSSRGKGDWETDVKPTIDRVIEIIKKAMEYKKQAREFGDLS